VNKRHLRGYGMIFLASIMFGSYGVWSKLMADEFGIFYQGWVRALIVALVILPILIYKKQLLPIERQDRVWLWVILGFTIFTQVPLYYGFITTGVGAATLMFYAAFLIASYLVGRFIIGEKITKTKILSLFFAFAGLGLVFQSSSLIFAAVGLLAAALNGVASGGEVSLSKKLSNKYPSLLITFYAWVAIFVTHFPLSTVVGESWSLPTLSIEWFAMVMYSLVGLLSFWLVVEGFRHVDASIGSLIGLAEIVWAILFGAILFHETFSLVTFVGAALILSAGVLPDVKVLYDKKHKHSKTV